MENEFGYHKIGKVLGCIDIAIRGYCFVRPKRY
jgi:hypothetical protein